MTITGYYYLHANGDLIYKRDLGGTHADLMESPFVKCFWPFDAEDRASAWRILVESLSLGANKNRVDELAMKWNCTNEDAQNYVKYLGLPELIMDGNQWCAREKRFVDLMESKAGFGETCLEALSELCKEKGFNGGKIWKKSFHELCA